jgi:hypothetical protein
MWRKQISIQKIQTGILRWGREQQKKRNAEIRQAPAYMDVGFGVGGEALGSQRAKAVGEQWGKWGLHLPQMTLKAL